MPLSEIYLDMLKKRRDAATPTAAAGAAVQAKLTNKLFDDVFSQSENEFEELQWDKGQLVVSRKSLAGCSPKSNDGVNAGDQGVVPWIQHPITDDLPETTNKTFIPPVVDDCVDLLKQLTGFDNHQDSNHVHNSTAAPVLFGRSQYTSGTGKSTDLEFRENSHPSIMSKVVDRSKGQDLKTVDFTDTRPQNQNLDSVQNQQPRSNVGQLNFSHFLRPALLANNTNPQGACKLKINETTTTASNVVESKVMECSSAFKSIEMDSRTESASYNVACQDDELTTRKKLDGCSSKVPDSSPRSTVGASSVLRAFDTVKRPETVVTSSSKCSANRADAASDPKDRQKRKITRESRHCAYDSEDEEGDSEDTKEPASGRQMSTKRRRAAEVHNLSESRRRDRINEKMHELQDLIPHCNKVDKVSMLEQAIDYLKMLKMQVQMMSMSSGMYMAPMMFSPAMQPPQMPSFSPMPMGMGFGMGMFNNNGSPMISIPTMHGPQFGRNFVAGSEGIPVMHGPASQQIDGTTGLRMPVLIPRPAPFPFFPGHSAMPNMPQITNSEPHKDNHKKNKKEESLNKRNPNN